ncbi:MAG: hypothetical protein ACO3ND_06315 [Opitutales bacterium]
MGLLRFLRLRRKAKLFLQLQLVTFAVGLALLLRAHTEKGTTFQAALDGTLLDMQTNGWFLLLPFFGLCLFLLRTDPRPRRTRQVFVKWSMIFLVMEFTTQWTREGWAVASSSFPVMALRFASAGAMAAAIWWLMERSPRVHPPGHSHSQSSHASRSGGGS